MAAAYASLLGDAHDPSAGHLQVYLHPVNWVPSVLVLSLLLLGPFQGDFSIASKSHYTSRNSRSNLKFYKPRHTTPLWGAYCLPEMYSGSKT